MCVYIRFQCVRDSSLFPKWPCLFYLSASAFDVVDKSNSSD